MGDVGLLIFLLMTILGGVALMIAAMHNRRVIREMEHRERLAMIDRGLIPPPETNPAAFEAAAGFGEPPNDQRDRGTRYRTAGVLLIGFGFGLVFVIGIAAREPEVGWGIGGAWISLGAASLFNYWLMSRRRESDRLGPWPAPAARRPEPPPNATP